MKRFFLFIVLSLILMISFYSCINTPAPEVEIVKTSPIGFSVSQFDADSMTVVQDKDFYPLPVNIDTLRYYVSTSQVYEDSLETGWCWLVPHYHYTDQVIVDTVVFVVKNGVEAILKGSYVEFYRGTAVNEPNEYLYSSPKYGDMSMHLSASDEVGLSEADTNFLYNFPLRIRKAVKKMYSEPYDTAWQALSAKVYFYGTDAYNDADSFKVYYNYIITRTE